MIITKNDVVEKIVNYLNHKITLKDLVNWAEDAIMEADLEETHFEVIRDVLSQIGLADVEAFGLTWEDCDKMLAKLGYRASVEVEKIKSN
ncbi:MAG: hypothetical protein D6813_15415 [Calditrichaeota bacterium]|nr:MAG: hypothetical protein D6813_15415 [Calditrichota bacterium]